MESSISVKLTLSVNAGISLETGDTKILIDAFPYKFDGDFSSLDDSLKEEVFAHAAFKNPDAVCYTHLHGDHYSKEITEEFCRKNPTAKLFMPSEREVYVGECRLSFIPLVHEGEEYKDVPNYGIDIEINNINILFIGDCQIAGDCLTEYIAGREYDLVVVDFPWVTLSRGKKYLSSVLRPKSILVNHLPLEKDDVNGFREATKKAIKSREFTDIDIRILSNPFDSDTFIFTT